jgi:cell division protein FtsB
VKDLKDGTKAIEERARAEHGMSKDGEIFVQVVPSKKPQNDPSKDEAKK